LQKNGQADAECSAKLAAGVGVIGIAVSPKHRRSPMGQNRESESRRDLIICGP
jgi:hypothetical protein